LDVDCHAQLLMQVDGNTISVHLASLLLFRSKLSVCFKLLIVCSNKIVWRTSNCQNTEHCVYNADLKITENTHTENQRTCQAEAFYIEGSLVLTQLVNHGDTEPLVWSIAEVVSHHSFMAIGEPHTFLQNLHRTISCMHTCFAPCPFWEGEVSIIVFYFLQVVRIIVSNEKVICITFSFREKVMRVIVSQFVHI
jgi:hypothetical protein